MVSLFRNGKISRFQRSAPIGFAYNPSVPLSVLGTSVTIPACESI
jgi:hypothetical protein